MNHKKSIKIQGIVPKDFRKIYHPEPELLTNEVSGDGCMRGSRNDLTQHLLE